jgi:hypothetical protein
MKITKLITEQTFGDGCWGEEVRTLITADYDENTEAIEIESVIAESNRIFKIDNTITHVNIVSVVDMTPMLKRFPAWDYEMVDLDWTREIREAKRQRRKVA